MSKRNNVDNVSSPPTAIVNIISMWRTLRRNHPVIPQWRTTTTRTLPRISRFSATSCARMDELHDQMEGAGQDLPGRVHRLGQIGDMPMDSHHQGLRSPGALERTATCLKTPTIQVAFMLTSGLRGPSSLMGIDREFSVRGYWYRVPVAG